MAVAFVGVGTTASGTTATITVPYPAGIASGHVAYAFSESGNGADPSPPTGFVQVASVGVGSSGTDISATKLNVFRRILDGTEGANITMNLINGHIVGKILVYSGQDTTTPETVSTTLTQTPAATTASTNSIASKTGDANDMFLASYAHDRDSSTASGISGTSFANIGAANTGRIVTSVSAAGGGGLVVMEGAPTGDSTGAVSHSINCTSTIWTSVLIRINASGSMGGGSTTYNDTYSESLTGSASISSIATFPNTHSASLTAAYNVATDSVFAVSVSEGLTASATSSAAATLANTLSEALTGSDGLSAGTLLALSLTESATAGESIASIGQFSDALSEMLTASDVLTADGGTTRVEPNISYRRRRVKAVDYGAPIMRNVGR